jgi:hypothetical protein
MHPHRTNGAYYHPALGGKGSTLEFELPTTTLDRYLVAGGDVLPCNKNTAVFLNPGIGLSQNTFRHNLIGYGNLSTPSSGSSRGSCRQNRSVTDPIRPNR